MESESKFLFNFILDFSTDFRARLAMAKVSHTKGVRGARVSGGMSVQVALHVISSELQNCVR